MTVLVRPCERHVVAFEHRNRSKQEPVGVCEERVLQRYDLCGRKVCGKMLLASHGISLTLTPDIPR